MHHNFGAPFLKWASKVLIQNKNLIDTRFPPEFWLQYLLMWYMGLEFNRPSTLFVKTIFVSGYITTIVHATRKYVNGLYSHRKKIFFCFWLQFYCCAWDLYKIQFVLDPWQKIFLLFLATLLLLVLWSRRLWKDQSATVS